MLLCKTCYALFSAGSTQEHRDMTENFLTGMYLDDSS